MNKLPLKDFVSKVKTLIEAGLDADTAKATVVKDLEKKGYTGSFILKEDGEAVGHADVDFKELEDGDMKDDAKAYAKAAADAMVKSFDALTEKLNKTVPATPRDEKEEAKFGFKTFGELTSTIFKAHNGRQDARLEKMREKSAPSVAMGSDVGEAGGFLLPQFFADTVLSYMNLGGPDLLSQTMDLPMSAPIAHVPACEQTPWGGTIQAFWRAELQTMTPQRPSFETVELKLDDLSALVPADDNLLQDSELASKFIPMLAGANIRYKVNQAIITGSGAGQPLGILSKGSPLVVVPAESGQASQTINFANVTKMYSRSLNKQNAAWLVTPQGFEQLMLMTMPGGLLPASFMVQTGFSPKPLPSIFGRPIVEVESCPGLGKTGDIVFADLGQYLAGSRQLQAASSIHLYFDANATAFRFKLRMDGKPWAKNPVASAEKDSKGNIYYRSSFVALAPRP